MTTKQENTPAREIINTPAAGAKSSNGRSTLAAIYATAGLTVLTTPTRNIALRFHAFQALFYVLAAFAAHCLFSFIGGALMILRPLYDLAALGYYGAQVWHAYQGTPLQIPVIAKYAHKRAAALPAGANDKSVQ